MFRYLFIVLLVFFKPSYLSAQGYDVFGIGIYDVKFDGSSSNHATDIRYERRFNNSIVDIGPEEDNFFYLKPFAGFEFTSDSAYYLISGIYLEDNLGELMFGEENKWKLKKIYYKNYY